MGNKASKGRTDHTLYNELDEVSFDDFEVLRSIGKGSFGKVCIVRWKGSDHEVFAMKYMNKLSSWKQGALEHVLKELDILSTLRHLFLVNLWFTFQDAEDIFMVSDLMLGGDLRYHILKRVRFTLHDVRIYLCQMGLALDYLRGRHILHRDIKPDNILMDAKGNLHLTDFNIATVLNDGHPCATSFAGTRPYIAPEIFQSSGYDYAVDWWSLGVTMYEVLRHKRPFHIEQNTTDAEIAALHRDGSISFPVDWDQAVMNLFFKFFKVEPQRRIQSFDDLASDEFCGSMSRDDVIEMKVATEFQPSRKELNYDPTFELEEMIMESNPLHKKKHRLEKLKSRRRNEEEWEKEWEHLGAKFQPFNRRRLEHIQNKDNLSGKLAESSEITAQSSVTQSTQKLEKTRN